MKPALKLGKFSFGMGDRFGHQGKAQLRACQLATELGAEFIPVWNKSNREHTFIGTDPSSLRAEADAAVHALGWKKSYHVDADHIRLETVDRFIAPSDFFTIDVADSIAKPAAAVVEKQKYETRQIKELFHGPEGKADAEATATLTEKARQPLANAISAAVVPVTHTILIQAE